jgi:putative membrane protein
MIRFSDEDRARITAAIHAAERNTSGEFVAVAARQSDHYMFLPLLWAACLALLVPGVLMLASVSWSWIHIYQLQLGLFILLALLFLSVPSLHLRLIPASVKQARASRMAKAQFYIQGVHMTREHSGVLFFVSLAERYVEIVADQGIHERVGTERWQRVVDTFVSTMRNGDATQAFAAAIEACGQAMSEHYPPRADDTNELSDGLIEI